MPATRSAALARAVGRYRGAPLFARLFVRGRALLADLDRVEAHVPRAGFVVDLGCGHGLFANLLVEASGERRVLGIDHDGRKIALARASARGRGERLRFETGDVASHPIPRCDAVTIVDVLYLLPPAVQERVLASAAGALAPGAPLVVWTQEARPGPRYALIRLQETLAARLGFTRGTGRAFHFPTRARALEMFARAGFDAKAIDVPHRAYPDVLYLARRRDPA